MTARGAVLGILGYFMCLRWWIVTGNTVEPGVTKPFLVKMWVCKGSWLQRCICFTNFTSFDGVFDGGDKL